MKEELLEESKRKKWTRIFIGFLTCFAAVCIAVMNMKYDALSRYPYSDKQSRELIKKYLNKEEISYIIEYSLPPNMFISFIKEDGFNIYHAAEYKQLSEYCWEETPAEIVRMVEETRDDLTTDGLIELLHDYTYEELHYFLENGDSYMPGTVLVEHAGNNDTYLNAKRTVSIRVPSYMILLEDVPTNGKEIAVSETIKEPLKSLCAGIDSDLKNENGCGGLFVSEGYVSYSTQEERYLSSEKDGSVNAPGHDEHQLGLAVDFAVNGLKNNAFALTEQSDWLQENAWKYGFMNTYDSEDEERTGKTAEMYHYRYVGEELAQELHENGMTFAEYSEEKEDQ